MDRPQDEVARRFRDDLVSLRQRAGWPSYSKLERVSNHQLKRATVSDVLNGKRVGLPDWRFVSDFVAACREVARESRLDPGDLGTVADWKQHWDEAASGVIGARFPGRNRGSLVPASSPRPREAVPGSEVALVPTAPLAEPRYPSLWGGVPPRIDDFIGRGEHLTNIQAAFTANGVLVVQGMGGSGKTRLVAEYAHRYAASYDLVWWVPCSTLEQVRLSMSRLALRLDFAADRISSGGTAFDTTLERLRRGEPYRRWLLILDDANDPEETSQLLPGGDGHVLITSRNSRWSASAEVIELGGFSRSESVEFLLGRRDGLAAADAHKLAEALGDLPLALEHAAGSPLPTGKYLSELASRPGHLLSAGQLWGYPVPVAETWQSAMRSLAEMAPTALELLRRLAFFGSGPIPLEALERIRYLPETSFHASLGNAIERSRATSALGRHGLLRIDHRSRTFRVHALVQLMAREELTETETERCRHDVHLLLAAVDPTNPGDFDYWPLYKELIGHIGACGLERCPAAPVRRLLTNGIDYLCAAGRPGTALSLADSVLDGWQAQGGSPEGPGAVKSYIGLLRAKTTALFLLGRYEDAFSLRQEIVSHPDAGKCPEEMVIVSRMAGSELRVAGKFAEALEADMVARTNHFLAFRPDHPQTFTAMTHLSLDHLLLGNYEEAMEIDREIHRQCLHFYDRPDHPSVLFARNSLGRSLRMAGYLEEALQEARAVHEAFRLMTRDGALDSDHPWVLINEADLLAAQRDAGLLPSMADPLALQAHRLHRSYWRVFGADHPKTLAAGVSLVSLLRRIPDRLEEAADLATDLELRFSSKLGAQHPYTYMCGATLAGIRRQLRQPGEAVAAARRSVAGLQASLGDDHHQALNGVVVLMNALADAGELEAGASQGRSALSRFQNRLGGDHPDTLACAANLVLVISALHGEREAEALRSETLSRYERTLGEDHPAVRSFLSRTRFDPDIVPLAL
jgi:NB-ARC domain-containing protein/tetratricopeptide repeat protein